ncbi:hypothetical protein [Caulobacter sp. 1776]|uniref:hypothetical protein n=1 Tax=Caulobacter sp. 1776 TaxID=3156420 RepID=UPI003395594A
MRKTSLLIAAFSLLALGSAAHAEDDMQTPAPAKPATTATPSPQQQQGMQHGGGKMHEQMMKDHAAGMAGMKAKKNPPASSGMMMGCSDGSSCKDKKAPGTTTDKPDAPMPMKDM